MNQQAEEARILRVCAGDREAFDFLCVWARYCHEVDDIIDGDRRDVADILSTFALAPMVYSHPFYLRHLPALRQVVLLVANMFAESVEWEKSMVPWRREFAGVYRHAGNEMVIAVAQLCGGYDHARMISGEQREICYFTQHPETKGEA